MENHFDINQFVSVRTELAVTRGLSSRFVMRRKEAGLTQKQLSTRSGVSYGSIRRFESQGEISLASLVKIGSAIGCLEDFESLFARPVIRTLRNLK